ncbi:AAHS family 4-hydroxybenzoate transporter-like MFS transporter [Sphingobium xanthum]|jgi:AAHS family 4-hydroxybenzoate transporter-like MFS transporter|uniref:MFS transporter n=1 Tax=Sphingobium xanthum TaxID=1387165 RepID=UPI001C8C94C7|nr:MFS transporter [Sphingobium xanthum]
MSMTERAEGQTGSWRGFILILIALVVEGFDLQAANFAAPSILEAFDLTRVQIGPLLSASLVGVLFGAVVIGPLGDRYGRRMILIASCLSYGVLSLVAVFATSLMQLIILRFLIGIGLGAVMPNALALAGEFAPRKHLARAVGLVGIGVTFGGVVAGAVAARYLPTHGWQSIFVAGGILPIIICVLLWFGLPESPALKRETLAKPGTSGLRAILSPAYRPRTLAIWGIFTMLLMVVYLLGGWIPMLIKDQGYSDRTAALVATAYHAGGVIGGITASLLLSERYWRILALFAAGAALSLAALSAASWGIVPLTALIVLAGALVTGTQNCINGSTGASYPAEMRASGLGWGLGLGRVGSIIGPLAGSVALMMGLGAPRHFFILPVLPLAIVCLLGLWLARHTGQTTGEKMP